MRQIGGARVLLAYLTGRAFAASRLWPWSFPWARRTPRLRAPPLLRRTQSASLSQPKASNVSMATGTAMSSTFLSTTAAVDLRPEQCGRLSFCARECALWNSAESRLGLGVAALSPIDFCNGAGVRHRRFASGGSAASRRARPSGGADLRALGTEISEAACADPSCTSRARGGARCSCGLGSAALN